MPETAVDQSEQKRRIFFPDLDGWRFVAFLAVFFFHSFYTDVESVRSEAAYSFVKRITVNGTLGVEFFFVLSGFLIIYLLIAERRLTGHIDIKKFYVRRILRIFPLYYLCLFLGFVVQSVLRSALGFNQHGNPDWRYYVFFLSNFDAIVHAFPAEATLGVLWSVAIEEQFYLVVPFILVVVPTRWYPWVFLSAIAVSLVSRANNIDNGMWLARHTFSFVGNLAIGGLIAYFSITSARFVRFFEDLDPAIIKGIYVLSVIMLLFQGEIFAYSILRVFQAPFIAALFALIILEQVFSKNSFFKMRNNRVFSVCGQFTYGLYCLHVFAMSIGHLILSKFRLNTSLWQVIFLETGVNLILALLIAYLSYRFYEAPFLRLKALFSFQNRDIRA